LEYIITQPFSPQRLSFLSSDTVFSFPLLTPRRTSPHHRDWCPDSAMQGAFAPNGIEINDFYQ
jgi:hypothetical protein